uniref:Chorion peroxidase-like n=1 Tax=Tetranychus truncatus TaxID=93132 RepID=A0A3G5AQH8_9ACAR|nr:chorion peroxidase-like [Tetranychus truncatus]
MTHHNLDTLALAYGQFLDHDLTQVVGSTLPNGGAITCCDSSNNVLDAKSLHPSCFPIIIPETDPFYSQYNVTCLNFARTAFGLPENCVLGPRTQINNLTPWVDASIVYGSNLETSNKLRAFTGGQLAHQTVSSGQILPPQNDICNNGSACLEGADSRVNQQPGLMATHITWLREHNRIAKELEKLNPTWSDEEIFQEARRIVIAEFQQVTYNEFLPLIIGSDLMKKYDLYPLESGFNEYYDPNLSPAIIQEFATAAFRLHTLIPGFIELRDSSMKVTRNTSLTKLYYNPSVFYEKPSVFQSIINGLLSQPVCPADNIITEAITNHLFPPGTHGSDEPWGFDLVSIDIQRGRDHGLAGYNEWREACGFKTAKNFSDLSEFFYPESLPLVEKLYKSVDDIDLVVGLNLEPRPEGQNVGPTAACIITETFRRLKFSDRFWFENAGQPSSFDLSQLNSIRNVTYARIHCDNNEIEFVQENAFLQPSDSNPRISCSQLSSKGVDLKLWKREALGTYGASLI